MTNPDPELEPAASQYLARLMGRYRVEHLVNATPAAFRQRIDSFLDMCDHQMEGYTDPARQRDLSIRFHWGHDHDFGAFALRGRMDQRHLWLLETFMDRLSALPRRLDGKRILDIGCWTGGTSLLLAAMGAHVVAFDEVRKYVDALGYLKEAFAISNLDVRHMSLFDCTNAEFQNSFDYVLFAGVLYHVTDPIIALRHVFNCLKDGGSLLLETMAWPTQDDSEPMIRYFGPSVFAYGSQEQMNRAGWNWFVPSRAAIAQMLADVGFTGIQTTPVENYRAFASARREHHVDILRAGLSIRDVT